MSTNFKPFWIETNQIFREVLTYEDFLKVSLMFIEKYPDLDILKLKISKYNFDKKTKQPYNDKENLKSFGLRGEHIHDIEYTLEDYFKS